jgi:hypothetical protein
MNTRIGNLLPFSLAAALGCAASTPAMALAIISEVGVSNAFEHDTLGNIVREDHADTVLGGPANAEVQLFPGTDDFGQQAFSQAFSGFRNGTATYWIDMNAANTRAPDNRGIGVANVHLNYAAVKEAGDKSFNLNVTAGTLRLVDPDGRPVPLFASATLEAIVTHGPATLSQASATATLTGHGGTFQNETFNLTSQGLDFQPGAFVLEDDGGNNVVAADVDIPKMTIPVDLSRIVDGTLIDIDVSLSGEVRAPGAEREAQLFFRDPTHINDADPFAGGATITFDTVSTGSGNTIPEPSTLALLGSALFLIGCRRRFSCR